jgi:hypothetical protein
MVNKMEKKWSCSECDYKSGRLWNVSRHIASNHNTGTPQKSIRFASKTKMGFNMGHSCNNSSESILTQSDKKQQEANFFAENYQFSDKKLHIIMQYFKAIKMKEGLPKSLIMWDLLNQFKQLVASPVIGFPNVKLADLSNFSKGHQSSTIGRTRLTSPPITSPPITSPPISSTQLPKSTINDDSLRYNRLDEFMRKKRVDEVMKYYADRYRHRCTNESFNNSFE